MFDDTIRLDTSTRPEVAVFLQWLILVRKDSGAEPNDKLFDIDLKELASAFKEAVTWLHLEKWTFVLYSCRHGGPSADRAEGNRTQEQVQKRGRWASDRSMRRYEQTGRLHAVIASLPAAVADFARRACANLLALVLQPRRLKRPACNDQQVPPPLPKEDA